MKKIITSLLLCSTIVLFSCSNGSSDSSGPSNVCKFPEGSNYVVLESKNDGVSFPAAHNGKECFLIYTNEYSANTKIGNAGIAFNENEAEPRSLNNDYQTTINKKVVKFENGYYRDEIHFALPYDFINRKSSNNRSVYNEQNTYSKYRSADNTKFWAGIGENSDRSTISEEYNFTLKAEGNHCRIWYYDNISYNKTTIFDLSSSEAEAAFKKLADSIDTLFANETNIFGSNEYTGDDGEISANNTTKLEVLVYDIFKDATPDTTGGIFGFFNPYDFLINDAIKDFNVERQKKGLPLLPLTSNECECIHIDSHFLSIDAKNDTNQVTSTLAHEFQHLLNYCNKLGNYETWFTEMLSMTCEEIFQGELSISDDDSPKGRFYFTFDTPYQGFGTWGEGNDVYNSYANAYAFGTYLMRNYGGVQLIHEIATNKYTNESAVTMALRKCGYDEDFYTVLEKFGIIYIFTEGNGNVSLNNSKTYNFGGVNYNITNINLDKYNFYQFDSKNDMDQKIKYLYLKDGQYGLAQNGYYYIWGPRIYRTNYKLEEDIQPYGFTVYYLGKVSSGKTYSVKNSDKLTMTVVVK